MEVQDEGVVATGDEGGEEEVVEADQVGEAEGGLEEGEVVNFGRPSADPTTFDTLSLASHPVSPLSASPDSSSPSPLIGGASRPLPQDIDARIQDLQYLG